MRTCCVISSIQAGPYLASSDRDWAGLKSVVVYGFLWGSGLTSQSLCTSDEVFIYLHCGRIDSPLQDRWTRLRSVSRYLTGIRSQMVLPWIPMYNDHHFQACFHKVPNTSIYQPREVDFERLWICNKLSYLALFPSITRTKQYQVILVVFTESLFMSDFNLLKNNLTFIKVMWYLLLGGFRVPKWYCEVIPNKYGALILWDSNIYRVNYWLRHLKYYTISSLNIEFEALLLSNPSQFSLSSLSRHNHQWC